MNRLSLIFGLIWGYNPGLEFGNLYEVESGGQKGLLNFFNFVYFIRYEPVLKKDDFVKGCFIYDILVHEVVK